MKQIFSQNGRIKPLADAQIPADKIEAMYGFGVYETMKVRKHILYFANEHIDRLLHSARCIKLDHLFTSEHIHQWIKQLVQEAGEESINIKMLLMGGAQEADATLYIFALPPLFPKRSWYKEGVTVKTVLYERWMPQAKSLNMLPSYYYYTQAKSEGHYDVLFKDSQENVHEGSRTNLYVVQGNTLVTPPKDTVLEGVTMKSLERVIAKSSSFSLTYRPISYDELCTAEGAFLSSTSTKIIPIREIDGKPLSIPPQLVELISLYNSSLEGSQGKMELL